MSVQRNEYLMLGARFSYDEIERHFEELFGSDDDAFYEVAEDYMDSAFDRIHHKNGLCVIADGMNGEYVYIGQVLNKSGNYGDIEDFEYNGERLSGEEIEALINKEFMLLCEVGFHRFTHYR